MNSFKMLIVENDQQVSHFLSERFTCAGYDVKTAATGRTALALLETTIFDATLVDIHLPDMLGLELLEVARQRDPEMDIVVMTGLPEIESAVQALRLGACDYVIKPVDWTTLHHCIDRIIERRYLRQEVASLRSQVSSNPPGGDLIGLSPGMLQIRDTIASVAPTDSAVLIEGESGTGKGVAAAAIHRSSARSNGPFVTVNCGAIPPDLLESEIFGHQKGGGATTDSRGFLRAAHAGTLFLTEVDQLPSELQPRLLLALQEKEVHPVGGTQGCGVDVRIIASTKESLVAAVQAGKFRQDLLLWLSASRIELPPLRQIKDDMGPLVLHFIRRFNRDFGRHVASVAPDAMAALMTYDFPGNVRELENIIERAYALGARDEIKFADLPSLILERRGPAAANAVFPSQSLDEFERELIVATLRTYDNNKEKVAQALGMSERTLYRRLKKLGV